jgi:hypothetical protein
MSISQNICSFYVIIIFKICFIVNPLLVSNQVGSVPDIRNLLGLDCQIQAMNRRIWQSGGSNVAKILGQTLSSPGEPVAISC